MFKIFKMEKCLKIDNEKTYYKHVFYILMACALVSFIVLAYLSGGSSFKGLFMSDTSDTFMDHYNSVVYNDIDPYENGVVYPPLATLTYGCLLKLIPEDAFDSIISDPTVLAQPRDIKLSQEFVFQFIIFTVAVTFLLLAAVYICKKGHACEKAFLSLLVLTSAPMLYALERGNNILIPLIFSLIFVNFYDSENKVIKEIALISLGIAVAFKLYPIAFGVLLFRNKQYKELVRAGIYCIVLTVLPFFLFYDGFNSINRFLNRLSGFDGKRSTSVNINGQLSFKSMFYYLTGFLRLKFSDTDKLADIFRYAVTGVCIAFTFFVKSNWKAAALCACFICGYQGSCPKYLLIFFFVPILMLLDGEKKNSFVNYFCLIFLILIVAPLVLPDPNEGGWSVYTSGKISSLSILAVAGIICAEAVVQYIISFVKFIKKKVGAKSGAIAAVPQSMLNEGGADDDK